MLLTKARILITQCSYVPLNLRFIYRRPPVVIGKYGEDQVNFINASLESSVMDWNDLRNNVISMQGNINNVNIDGVLLKMMVSKKNFDAAKSFVKHLKSTTTDFSLGSINGLLAFYHELGKESDLSDNDKLFILDIYQKLYNKYKVLDSTTSENLVHSLCTINEWEKALRVLDDICLSSVPTHSAYSTVISVLFKNNKKKKALEIIQVSQNKRRSLQENAYDAWIDYIFRKYKDKEIVAKYMDEICTHISKSHSLITMNTARQLMNIYNSLGWKSQLTKIRRDNGQCLCCQQTLDCLKLSKEEFEVLRKNIKDKLIVGSDLFLKTSPDELKKFLEFIEISAPFDIVLDALNIGYAVGKGSTHQRILALNNVVDYFLEKNKKVLVLGRRHMLNWQKDAFKKILEKTNSFFIDNMSQDDPYFITAAIMSGPHADIVSKDLLRGHLFLLKEEKLSIIFQRWQWQHQWMVFLGSNKKFNIQPPLKFTPCAQKKGDTWHLPYKCESEPLTTQFNNGIPNLSTWLCISAK